MPSIKFYTAIAQHWAVERLPAIAIVVVAITFASLIIGELVPQQIDVAPTQGFMRSFVLPRGKPQVDLLKSR